MRFQLNKKMVKIAVPFLCMAFMFGGGKEAFAQEMEPAKFAVTDANQFVIENSVLKGYLGEKETVEEIVIPDGVIAIEDGAFQNCSNLKTVIIPDRLEVLGKQAFANSGIVTMAPYTDDSSDGEVSIDHYQENVVTLPSKLTTIDATAFSQARSICNFAISQDNAQFMVQSVNADQTEIGELLLSKDGKKLYRMAPAYGTNDVYSIPEGIEELMANSLESNMGGNRKFVIPVTVTTIGDYAFYGCNNLNGIVFTPESKVSKIGAFAFAKNSNISTDPRPLTLPESVTEIGESCFKDCVNMEIDISKTSIVSIPQFIFNGCVNIHTVTLPKTLKYLEAYAFFENDNLNEIIFLGDNLEKIGTGAFQGCNNLHGIDIPEGIVNIENDTFDGCWNLEKIILPDSVEIIGDNAFKDCKNIKEMVIPPNVKEISNSSFTGAKQDAIDTSKNAYAQEKFGGLPKQGTIFAVNGIQYKITKSAKVNGTVAACGVTSKKVKKLTIEDTVKKGNYIFKVTAVSKNAFKKCTKLKSVTIGKNVTSIGANAFNGDKKLGKIFIRSTKMKTIGKNAFKNIKKNAVIKVPKKKVKAYKKLFKKRVGYKETMQIKKK